MSFYSRLEFLNILFILHLSGKFIPQGYTSVEWTFLDFRNPGERCFHFDLFPTTHNTIRSIFINICVLEAFLKHDFQETALSRKHILFVGIIIFFFFFFLFIYFFFFCGPC